MSLGSAKAGCQLNATPGLRKHWLCPLTDSLSHNNKKKGGLIHVKFDPRVISPEIMNLFLWH